MRAAVSIAGTSWWFRLGYLLGVYERETLVVKTLVVKTLK